MRFCTLKRRNAKKDTELAKLAYVVASQGHSGKYLGEGQFQPWVENVNRLLEIYGFRMVLFGAGDLSSVYYSKKRKLEISIDKKISFLTDYFSIPTTFRMLLSKRPALVVVHGLQHLLTLAALLTFGLAKKTSVLLIVHGVYESRDPISLLRDKVIKYLLKLLDRTNPEFLTLFLTNYDRNYLSKKWGVNNRAVAVSFFPLYVSLDETKALSKAEDIQKDENRDVCTFLYMGRLSLSKQIDKIILALYRLLKKDYKGQLMIVGDGPAKEQIASLIEKLRLNDSVKMVGAVLDHDKWSYYVKCDALVLASKFEGLPRVIIEAFIAGKPVIVPNICGIPEIVANMTSGFIFEDHRDLEKYMIKVIEKRNLPKDVALTNKDIVWKKMILEKNGLKDFGRLISKLSD